MTIIRTALALAALSTATMAAAQDMTSSIIDTWSTSRNAIMSSHIAGLSIKKMQQRKGGRSSAAAAGATQPFVGGSGGTSAFSAAFQPVAGGAQLVPPAPATLAYRPDPAVRAQVQRDFLTRLERNDPANAKHFAALSKKTDFFQSYRQMSAPEGYTQNNVADALASYLVIGWVCASGREIDPNEASQRAVRSRVATILSEDPRMRDPKMRQMVGDELQILSVILGGGFVAAQQEGTARNYGDGVAKIFAGLTGEDLRRWSLTDAGFVRR